MLRKDSEAIEGVQTRFLKILRSTEQNSYIEHLKEISLNTLANRRM